MELVATGLSGIWLVGGALFGALAIARAWRQAPWAWLRRRAAARYLVTLGAVLVVWQIRAGFGEAPAFHLLGATLLTLAFGWSLALLGLGLVLTVSTAFGNGDVAALGLNTCVLVMLPVAISYGWARATERVLPRHFFVYLFVAGFFGAALAAATAAVASAAVLYLASAAVRVALGTNYLPTALLLVFPEAFLTGTLVTLAAVYRPAWLVSYDDATYLR